MDAAIKAVMGLTENDPWLEMVESVASILTKAYDGASAAPDALAQMVPFTKVAKVITSTKTGMIMADGLAAQGSIDLAT